MDVKIFSLYTQENDKIRSGIECIEDCVCSFFSEVCSAEHYTSQKRMVLAVSQSLRAADVVVVAVSSEMYNTTKRLLCNELGIVTDVNDELASMLTGALEKGEIKQSIFESETCMPVGAEIMPTGKGRKCGFALTRESQSIVYLPLESPKADQVVLGSLYDFLAEVTDEDYGSAFEKRSRRIFLRTVENLENNNIKTVFRLPDGNDYFSRYSDISSKTDCIVIDSEAENESDSEVSVPLKEARKMKEKHFAHYGVFVEEIKTDDEGNRYAGAVISDEEGTDTFRLFAGEGESDGELYEAVMNRLMLMLYDYNFFADITFSSLNDSSEDKALRSFALKAVGAGLLLSSLISLIVAFIMK